MLKPNPHQTVLDRYSALKDMGAVLYGSLFLKDIDNTKIRSVNLEDNILKEIWDTVRSSFSNTFLSYSGRSGVVHFLGGGAEKIFGMVPYLNPNSTINPFKESLENVANYFKIPILEKGYRNLKKGFFGDVHFLNLEGKNIEDARSEVDQENERNEFFVFALPAHSYHEQPDIREFMDNKKLEEIKGDKTK